MSLPLSSVLGDRSSVEEWSVRLPRPITAPPAVGEDGTLYVPTDRSLIAMSPEDGAIKWERAGVPTGLAATARVTPDGDTVYVTGSYGETPQLAALDAADGRTRWQLTEADLSPTEDPVVATPAGLVYAERWPGRLQFVDRNGREGWSHETRLALSGGVAAAPNGSVYVAGAEVAAVKDGKLLWRHDFPSDEARHAGTRVAVTDESELLYTTNSSKIRKIGPDGEVDWEFSSLAGQRVDELSPQARAALPRRHEFDLATSPVLSPDGETIYAGGFHGKIVAVDQEGHQKWARQLPIHMAHSGVQVGPDGTVYAVNDQQGTVFALRPEDGRIAWKFESTAQDQYASLSVDGDRVILAIRDGSVHALSSEGLRRALEREPQAPAGPAPTIDLGDGVITIGDVQLPVRS